MNKEQREHLERYQREYPATARLEHYLKEAQKYREGNEVVDVLEEVTVDEEGKTHTHLKRHPVRELEISILASQQALDKGDIDHFVQEFERVIRYTVELNLPKFEADIHSKAGIRANKGRVQKYASFKSLAISLYEETKPWRSVSDAARSSKLTGPINAQAEKLGKSPPAFRTIRDYLLEHNKALKTK